MKLNRFLILFVFVLLLSNCTGNQQNKVKNGEVELAQQANSSQSGHEDFYAFLDNFSTNRIFQLKRIVFPVTILAPDASKIALVPVEEKIEKMDWELLDLTYDSTYTTRDYDKYTQTVHFRGDTAQVSQRGIDNGIFADYFFKLIDGEWFLVKLAE